MIKNILSRLGTHSGLITLVRHLEARRGNLVRILTYHRIGDPADKRNLLDPSLISATPQLFEQQMAFLARNYRLISIPELLYAIDFQKPLPPQSVLVSFDDGYRDFLDNAWPILEYYHIPTVLFIPTGFLSSADSLFWWDRLFQGIFRTSCTKLDIPSIGIYTLENIKERLEALKQLKEMIRQMEYYSAMKLVDTVLQELKVIPETKNLLLNWSDARYLSERGCFLAAHTRQHPILSRISINDARKEIQDSQQDICKEVGITWPVFAYPSGHFCDIGNKLTPILKEEGIKVAMTMIPGFNFLPQLNLFQLKRIGVSINWTMQDFPIYLTGIYHFYCYWKQFLNRKNYITG